MNNEKSACCGAPVEIYDSDENGNTFWQCSKCNLRCKTYRERSVGVVAPKENYIGGAEDVKCPKCGVLMLREAKGLRCMNCEPEEECSHKNRWGNDDRFICADCSLVQGVIARGTIQTEKVRGLEPFEPWMAVVDIDIAEAKKELDEESKKK